MPIDEEEETIDEEEETINILSTNVAVTSAGFNPTVASSSEEYISYEKISFSDMSSFVFTEAEIEDDDFYPSELPMALYFYPINQLGISQPSFLDEDTWKDIKTSSSGFISGNKTIIPKIVFPTKQVCSNGLVNSQTDATSDDATYDDRQAAETFNWGIPAGTGTVNTSTKLKDYGYKYPDTQNKNGHYKFFHLYLLLNRYFYILCEV
jgi:hypothetical protein